MPCCTLACATHRGCSRRRRWRGGAGCCQRWWGRAWGHRRWRPSRPLARCKIGLGGAAAMDLLRAAAMDLLPTSPAHLVTARLTGSPLDLQHAVVAASAVTCQLARVRAGFDQCGTSGRPSSPCLTTRHVNLLHCCLPGVLSATPDDFAAGLTCCHDTAMRLWQQCNTVEG